MLKAQEYEKQLKNIKVKTNSYKDINNYAVELGKILATAFNIYFNEKNSNDTVEKILNNRLKENHRLITEYGKVVQNILNKQAKIGLVAQIPEVNQNRIDGLISRLIEGDFEDNKWLLGSPIVNFSQAVVDDMVRKNAEFHFHSGMSPKIVRKEVGNCCKWCKSLVGTYSYPDVPKDVYRRHRNCRCAVEYYPGKGKKQNVWNKKWKDIEKDDKIKERIERSKKVDYKPLNDGLIEKYQSKSDEVYANLSKSEREALSEYTQGGYLDINSDLGSGIESYYTKSLNGSIDKFTVDSNIITYRGTNENYYKGYKVGDTFEGKVFYSTSVNKEQAKVFADDVTEYSDDGSKGVLLEIKVPKGSKALYIGKNTDYKPDGYTVNEYELLLSNKTKYKIEKIENGKIVLEMIL